MSRRALTTALFAFAWLAAPGAASAEETLLGMIRAHPECRQFNDGCSICRVENGTAACSAPVIACIRTGWTCAGAAAAMPPQEGAPLAKAASIEFAGSIGRQVARLPET